MHMADALISPVVGGSMWAASAGMLAYSAKRLRHSQDERQAPLMGIMGAFVFAAQMINFAIPATGASGHLGGGLLLAVLLGPYAAFLTIAAVLMIQALFFADGGLLALGCNIFNLGFFPAFVAYPLVYRPLINARHSRRMAVTAAVLASVTGLQLGSCAVVLETVISGVSSLPFATFFGVMQPIHLAIGIVEGLVTASVLSFVLTARPEIFQPDQLHSDGLSYRNFLLIVAGAALLAGGVLTVFASKHPDGLEWAINKVSGIKELAPPDQGIHAVLKSVQQHSSLFPEYSFKKAAPLPPSTPPQEIATSEAQKINSSLQTSLSGLIGGVATLGLILATGLLLRRRPVS